MKSFFALPVVALLAVPSAAISTEANADRADNCSVSRMACEPPEIRAWKDVALDHGISLASYELDNYAYACVEHPEWKRDCENDPALILRRIGLWK